MGRSGPSHHFSALTQTVDLTLASHRGISEFFLGFRDTPLAEITFNLIQIRDFPDRRVLPQRRDADFVVTKLTPFRQERAVLAARTGRLSVPQDFGFSPVLKITTSPPGLPKRLWTWKPSPLSGRFLTQVLRKNCWIRQRSL